MNFGFINKGETRGPIQQRRRKLAVLRVHTFFTPLLIHLYQRLWEIRLASIRFSVVIRIIFLRIVLLITLLCLPLANSSEPTEPQCLPVTIKPVVTLLLWATISKLYYVVTYHIFY